MKKIIIALALLLLSNGLNIGLGKGSPLNMSDAEKNHQYTAQVVKDVLDVKENKKHPYVSELVGRAMKEKNSLFNDSVMIKIQDIANRHGFKPSWLVAIIMLESNADPKAQNSKSRATGIIQFLPSTARGLGTSIDELLSMNTYQQLDYVDKYFSALGRNSLINSFEDMYLAVFYPKGLGKSNDYVIGHKESLTSKQNPTINREVNGSITVGSFKSFTRL